MEEKMVGRIPSDDEIQLLKRALASRCEHLSIVPEGCAAHIAAEQILELFDLGITDERKLAMATISVDTGRSRH